MENGGAYGMAVGSVPSKVVPQVVEALTERYVQERENREDFRGWVGRVGKRDIRKFLGPFMKIPAYDEDPSYFSDWSDVREFTIGDLGIGECAGEVVSLFGIEVVRAESQSFDAQCSLDEGEFGTADQLAYQAMLSAARALVRTEYIDVSEDPDEIVSQWKQRFFDTELFFDKYAKGKFGQYLLERYANPVESVTRDYAAARVEESQLFIEACHAAETRLVALQAIGAGGEETPVQV